LRSSPYNGNYKIFLFSVITILYYVCSDRCLLIVSCHPAALWADVTLNQIKRNAINRKMQLLTCTNTQALAGLRRPMSVRQELPSKSVPHRLSVRQELPSNSVPHRLSVRQELPSNSVPHRLSVRQELPCNSAPHRLSVRQELPCYSVPHRLTFTAPSCLHTPSANSWHASNNILLVFVYF
jgi:hypothetical protein